jgi:hypothetical protein
MSLNLLLVFGLLLHFNNSYSSEDMSKAIKSLSVPRGYPEVPYPQREIVKVIEGKKYNLIFVRFFEECKKGFVKNGEQCIVKPIFNKIKFKNYSLYPFDFPYSVERSTNIWTPINIKHEYYKEGMRLFNSEYKVQNKSVHVSFETCRECDGASKFTAIFGKSKKTKKWVLEKLK